MGFLQNYKTVLDGTIILAESNGVAAGDLIEANSSKAEAGEAGYGVAMHSADNGDSLTVMRIGECELTGGAAIAVGADIEWDGTKYITKNTGVKVGKALTACSGNNGKFQALINLS